MKSGLICFVGLHFAITLVNSVSGWKCEEYPVQHGVMNAPFNFAYLSNSDFNILMLLKNVSPKIIAIEVAVETDGPALTNKFRWDRDRGDYFRLCGELQYNKVTISLELSSSNGLCGTRVVSEGRHARILERGLADPTYESSHFCLDMPSDTCAIEIDLSNDCIESNTDGNAKRKKTFVTPKPTHHYSNTTRNNSNTPKPTISASPKSSQNFSYIMGNQSITPRPTISTILKATQNYTHTTQYTSITSKTISDTPNATQNVSETSESIRNISRTSNATWYTSDAANATVMERNDAVIKIAIPVAITGMVLILLVIITIWKCCRIDRNPSGSAEFLSNVQSNPFYLNLLFRRECDREIELIEQHHYEEIKL